MRTTATGLALVCALLAAPTGAVEVPPEGQCPPYPLPRGEDGDPVGDVAPPLFQPGERIAFNELGRIADHLPEEVWGRRRVFFYEEMRLELGPCHRRYLAPPFFVEATERNAGAVRLDERGNLHGYGGEGLPFPWQAIPDDAPDAGLRWAWSYRYRYQGSGFRGSFRILQVARRGQRIDRFTGSIYLLPMHGVPGATRNPHGARFWAGGRFESPEAARGVAWRQLRVAEADVRAERSDEIWVYTPGERRVRRAPPIAVDGIYTPSYMRGSVPAPSRVVLPQGISTPGASISVAEHTRVGFTGLLLRPNGYEWRLLGSRDVIAPINARGTGFPLDAERSYGPSGQSLASDRWDLRRAVVIQGLARSRDDPVGSVTLFLDVLTQQPLYLITRRRNGHIIEVGIFMGRFSGDDPLHPDWTGSRGEFGTILPVAASFTTGASTGWLRESFELRSDPPSPEQVREFTSTRKLQRGR